MAKYFDFYNTYHFLPLGEKVKRSEDMLKERENQYKEKREDLYTGKIRVRLTARTPLFIPDIPDENRKENKKEQEYKIYKFFSYDGTNPVIPGSSIRGMLRSVYETLTNSCLSVINVDEK